MVIIMNKRYNCIELKELTLDLLNLEKHFVYILVEILEIIKKAI